jgi:hypothetical protein
MIVLSLQYYRKAILQSEVTKDSSDAFIGMAEVFDGTGQTDSAIYICKKGSSTLPRKKPLFCLKSFQPARYSLKYTNKPPK